MNTKALFREQNEQQNQKSFKREHQNSSITIIHIDMQNGMSYADEDLYEQNMKKETLFANKMKNFGATNFWLAMADRYSPDFPEYLEYPENMTVKEFNDSQTYETQLYTPDKDIEKPIYEIDQNDLVFPYVIKPEKIDNVTILHTNPPSNDGYMNILAEENTKTVILASPNAGNIFAHKGTDLEHLGYGKSTMYRIAEELLKKDYNVIIPEDLTDLRDIHDVEKEVHPETANKNLNTTLKEYFNSFQNKPEAKVYRVNSQEIVDYIENLKGPQNKPDTLDGPA